MKSSRFFLTLCIPVLILAVIIFASFSRTIGSYFLEDDFGEVLYVSQIFSGNWQKIITNFTGNYMEIPTMKVYRPCLLLSLIADYALWGTKAYGYFITNIFFLLAAAVMLYLVLTELTRSWYRPRSVLFAVFSTALFASSPLHCESVSLMVGRVDIICAFFYLLALWSFVRKGDSNSWKLTALGVLSFWVALLTKEMAIGLPLLLTSIGFFFSDKLMRQAKSAGVFTSEQVNPSFYQRLILSLKVSYPLWLSCFFYFIIRYLALGTIFGGYVGSVGASQFSHILQKWTDWETVYRIIFPLSKAVFLEHDFFHSALFFIYLTIFILVFARVIISGIPRMWLIVIAIWTATVLAPIYQLWGLGFNLEGARFLFFLTIPLSIFLPLLIFAPSSATYGLNAYKSNGPSNDIDMTEIKLLIPGIIALLFLIVVDTTIAAKNNIPWVHAGTQTRSLLQEGQNLAQGLTKDQKVIILGIPKEVDGAHVIYNGLTFNFIMSPPFSKDNYADRFITFDPILFGNADLINTSHFKQELLRPDIVGCYIWRADKKIFEKLAIPIQKQLKLAQTNSPLTFPLPTAKDIVLPFTWQRGSWQINPVNINIQHCEKGSGIEIAPITIDPFLYDFMEIKAAASPSISPDHINVSWCSDSSSSPTENMAKGLSLPQQNMQTDYKVYRIALSRHWRWFTLGQLNKLYLEFPPAQSILLKEIRLLNDFSLVPKFSIDNLQANNTGVYKANEEDLVFSADGSHVDGCTGLKIEVSKPNYFFENFDSNSKDAVLTELLINEVSNKHLISKNVFSARGFYQIRAICLNKNGNTEGEWTDPLTIRVD